MKKGTILAVLAHPDDESFTKDMTSTWSALR